MENTNINEETVEVSEEVTVTEETVTENPIEEVTENTTNDEDDAKKKKSLLRKITTIIIIILVLLMFLITTSEIVTAVYPTSPWAVRYQTMKDFLFGRKDKNTSVSVGGQTEGGLSIDNNATNAPKPDNNTNISDRSVFFAGIDNAVVDNNTIVYLDNPEENLDFYMKYMIYEGNTLIYETNLIASGQYVPWELDGVFTPGEHILMFNEIPYYQVSDDEWMQLTTGVNEVIFTVIE